MREMIGSILKLIPVTKLLFPIGFFSQGHFFPSQKPELIFRNNVGNGAKQFSQPELYTLRISSQ